MSSYVPTYKTIAEIDARMDVLGPFYANATDPAVQDQCLAECRELMRQKKNLSRTPKSAAESLVFAAKCGTLGVGAIWTILFPFVAVLCYGPLMIGLWKWLDKKAVSA